MAIDPNSAVVTTYPSSDERTFNKAVAKAQENDTTSDFDEAMASGIVTVGGQMIIMPRANDILGEALSDDD